MTETTDDAQWLEADDDVREAHVFPDDTPDHTQGNLAANIAGSNDPVPGTEIVAWADEAMYEAQPMLKDEGVRIHPKVFIMSATPDPLGTCAVDMRMYRGDPVYSTREITDKEREWAWEELSKTHLNTPLEGVSIKFMIEAVTRSFTHQMVRQRVGAYYVQESLRFAVKRGIANETALPPSIATTEEGAGKIWHDAISAIGEAYNQLVDAGIPAEDARGLLPHAVTTRILYHTNLRALFEHAGNRLCTQAQFEWRAVFMGIINAISNHQTAHFGSLADGWQWKIIAQPKAYTFTPICYRLGRCAFKSELDRGCSIRSRVDGFAAAGVSSEQWGNGTINSDPPISPIRPEEWMVNALAGTTRTEWGQTRPE
jgi:flavin-dependent thymidylate synthase